MASSNSASPSTRRIPVFVKDRLPWYAIALWFTGAARMFREGAGVNAIWRWWHPVTWLLLVVMVLPFALMGEALLRAVPLKLSKFWRINSDQLQWVTPFTRLDTLKPFSLPQARRRLAEAQAAEDAEDEAREAAEG